MKPLQLVISLTGIIVVIIACYYATYYLGTKAQGRSSGRHRGRNINLLDRFAISKDKSFCIIEIAGKVYIVGMTNQSMTLIDTLDPAVFEEQTAERNNSASWYNIPGGQIGGKLASKLASFIVGNKGQPRGTNINKTTGNEMFKDSMKTAREKSISGKPDRIQTERPDDPEVEE